jgi:hypothetical protein
MAEHTTRMRTGAPHRLHVDLELDLGNVTISGTATGGPEVPFVGWMALTAALDLLLHAARADACPDRGGEPQPT